MYTQTGKGLLLTDLYRYPENVSFDSHPYVHTYGMKMKLKRFVCIHFNKWEQNFISTMQKLFDIGRTAYLLMDSYLHLHTYDHYCSRFSDSRICSECSEIYRWRGGGKSAPRFVTHLKSIIESTQVPPRPVSIRSRPRTEGRRHFLKT
jgi:hypothetical protein